MGQILGAGGETGLVERERDMEMDMGMDTLPPPCYG